jgi:uncharacterized protein YbjT (DUF2867 family)
VVTTLITVVPPRRLPGAVPTGPVGRRLARQLLAAGETVRVLAPGPEARGWPDGVELIEGSVLDPAASPQAFSGLDRMFLAGATPETRDQTPRPVYEVLRRAADGGVRQATVLSSHGPVFEIRQPPEQWYWLAVERAVEESIPSWTHIRPSAVMASILDEGYPPTGSSWAATIRGNGVIREPNIDAAYPFIDEDDLAAVAVVTLLSTAHAGSVIEAIGPSISTRARIDIISNAIGRPVNLEELSPDQARQLWREQGWPAETIETTLWAQAQFIAQPLAPDTTIERVLGHPARTFEQWINAHLDAFC